MGLLGSLIGTAVDIVTTPVDVIADVANTLEGKRPEHVENKLRDLGNDAGNIVKDTVRGDFGIKK